MGELVDTLRRFGELDVSDELVGALVVMSAATMDRRLAPDSGAMVLRGRSHTKPRSLLKDPIPIRTWAQWDHAVPGFVEIDLVGHEGGNAIGISTGAATVATLTGTPAVWAGSGPRRSPWSPWRSSWSSWGSG